MPKFGAHMSISGGVHNAFEQARKTGCDAIQIFTKSNRFWKARDLKDAEISKFHEELAESGIGPVVTHASYLINLGSPDDALWEKSMNGLKIELERCETLKIPYLVLHPGAHMKKGPEAGVARVSAALDQVHDALPDHQVKVTLEITAGQGTALGRSFEELAAIRDGVQAPERLVFCFDTCHALATGYEFRSEESYQQMMTEMDEYIGIENVKVMHINDSKGDLESHLDRHTHIGEGHIGLEPFGFFINDPRLAHAPFLLETPQEVEIESDQENLAKLRSLVR
ncbi:MAG: deoxyribonuclease IV [Chloroflexota bacterium]